MGRYKRKEDSFVLEEIKKIIKVRPTYGYKRVTAMINKKRKKNSEKKLNKKRVYRIMDMNGLLFKKAPRGRNHQSTGKVTTLHSNTRWCSDAFEIHCFNAEKLYVTFALDCHDRECLAYVVSRSPLVQNDIQELMIKAVEGRFGKLETPRPIQFLSDRGSIYRAKDTVNMGRLLGLKPCFTAAYSPESNGMSESFVNTIKRDYVYTSDCLSPKEVEKLLPKWIKDYNEEAPHSGLGMMSPREYIESRRNLAKSRDQEGSVETGQQPGRAIVKI